MNADTGRAPEEWRDLETATHSATEDPRRLRAPNTIPGLSILCHPNPERVGEHAALIGLRHGGQASLSRLEPNFETPSGERRGPLADPRLSRQPIRLTSDPEGGLIVDASATSIGVEINGSAIEEEREITAQELEGGVVFLLSGRIALVLHRLQPSVVKPPTYGMIGESASMVQLRRDIERISDLQFSVLLRGESGTGKELVASAIRHASPRREKPFVTVNMAAIPPTLATAELFGAAKGAFSGADRKRDGYFERADGGTLFLDEIGETPPEVQVLLLRALETGEIQPVGSAGARSVDVRVIAATDADLEQAITNGSFKAPLLNRLASYEIALPPLRERRDDIGRLFFHFLRQELAELGMEDRLDAPGRRPWVRADIVARLATFAWPGNVRQLRNVIRQLTVASRGADEMEAGPRLEQLLAQGQSSTPQSEPTKAGAEDSRAGGKPRAAAKKYRDPGEIGTGELLSVLRAHQFRLKPAASALGISRASLYVLIDACPKVRKASQLSADEINQAASKYDGRPDSMAQALEVSKQGLKMRMKELGLR